MQEYIGRHYLWDIIEIINIHFYSNKNVYDIVYFLLNIKYNILKITLKHLC